MEHDNRLRVNHSEVTLAGSTTNDLMKADFSDFADSRVAAKDDLLDNKWDRTNKYDFAGRLVFNQFGMGDASDPNAPDKRVYEQSLAFDAFSNMTTRSGLHWDNDIGYVASYVNGRTQEPNVTFDAAGNIVHRGDLQTNPHEFADTVIDASGRQTLTHTSMKGRWGSLLNMVTEQKHEMVFDGDGRAAYSKSGVRGYNISSPPSGSLTTSVTTYAVWSTVLGQILTELMPDGSKLSTSIYAGGAKIGTQGATFTSAGMTYDNPGFETADPVTGASAHYAFDPVYGTDFNTRNIEPLGQEISSTDPVEYNGPPSQSLIVNSAGEPEWQCAMPWTWKFMPFHCQQKVIKSAGATLPWEFETKTSIKRIVGVDAPANPYEPSDSGSNLAMAYALRSTAKPNKDDPDIDYDKNIVTVHAPPDLPIDLSERFDASVGMVFDDFTIAKGQSISENPCDLMAQSAQNIIDNLKNYPNLTDQQKLEEFTRTFQTWYTGGWVGTSNTSAYTFFNNYKGGVAGSGSGGIGSTTGPTGTYSNLDYNEFEEHPMSGRVTKLKKSSAYRGQKDFLLLYQESSSKGSMEDQTHHFAAYFALGIAGLSTASAVAAMQDRYGGLADTELGNRAYSMGDFFRQNPRYNELRNLPGSIRSLVCKKKK